MAAFIKLRVLPAKSRIRVLVVDDSLVIRRLVTHALSEDEGLEVVGEAPNGRIALQRIPQLKPDVVTLDIEMPELNGLETLREIRKLYPALVVIMFSTLTARGASSTLEALTLGANDYVTKAANVGSLDKSMVSLRTELVPKIKQFFQIGEKQPVRAPAPAPVRLASTGLAPPNQPFRASGNARIVAIGVSTGGPTALAVVMPMFPKDFPLPIVIVQHMPQMFTRLLAERLDAVSAIRVEEAEEGSKLTPGKAILAAGGYHMRLKRREAEVLTTLDQEPAENSCRPAVDVLFRSVAEIYRGAVITVMLTGMGYDGLRGTELLKGLGAYVIAQDEQSSVVWGMPGSLVHAGLANAVVDVAAVVPEIAKQLRMGLQK